MTGDTTIENAPGSLNCDGESRCRCKVGYRSPRAVCVVSFTLKLHRYAVLNAFARIYVLKTTTAEANPCRLAR